MYLKTKKSANKNSPDKNTPDKDIQWFTTEVLLPDQIPEDQIVEFQLKMILNDIGLYGKQREPLMALPISAKWDFIVKQNYRDRHTKAAEYLIKKLREKATVEILGEIYSNLAHFRLSYSVQFFRCGGHLELMVLLANIQTRIDFHLKQEEDYELMRQVLCCIRTISNNQSGLYKIIKYKKFIPIIINCINPNKRILENIFEILIMFIFGDKDEDYQLNTLKKILLCFHELIYEDENYEEKNGWEVIKIALKTELSNQFLKFFNSFLNAILLILNKNMPLFTEWYNEIEKIGLIDVMKTFTIYDSLLKHIEEQRQMHIHGINMKIISSLSIDNNSEKEKGQLDDIMNQLNQENFLSSEDIFFNLDDLEVQKKLGKGTFGVVYQAKCKENNEVYAVKVSLLKVDEETKFSDETLSMFREVNLMSSFNFPTILKFIGYSPTNFKNEFYPTIIMEFAVNKTLKDVIELENKGLAPEGWDDTRKLINIYGIAAGMKYLHQQNVVHRDLKSQNILMDELLCPKIADFGLSKMTKNSTDLSSLNLQSISNFKGTPLYMAPEILSGQPCSFQGDVYAFAFIVYEIVTGTIPFENLTSPVLYMKIMNGERPDFPSNVPDHFVKLISSCWDQSPDERPTFDEIVNELKNNESFITDSIDESNFIDFIDFVDNYQSTFDLHKKHILLDDFIKGKRGNATLKKVYIEEY